MAVLHWKQGLLCDENILCWGNVLAGNCLVPSFDRFTGHRDITGKKMLKMALNIINSINQSTNHFNTLTHSVVRQNEYHEFIIR